MFFVAEKGCARFCHWLCNNYYSNEYLLHFWKSDKENMLTCFKISGTVLIKSVSIFHICVKDKNLIELVANYSRD